MRVWTIVLLRIRCRGRSTDVVDINLIWSHDPSRAAIAGLHGVSPRAVMATDAMHPHVNIDAATASQYVSVRRVRYDFPKNSDPGPV